MARKGKPQPKPPMPNLKKGSRAFFKEVVKEMHRVIWPSQADTTRLTTAVLVVCTLFIIYLWVAGSIVEMVINLLEGKSL